MYGITNVDLYSMFKRLLTFADFKHFFKSFHSRCFSRSGCTFGWILDNTWFEIEACIFNMVHTNSAFGTL